MKSLLTYNRRSRFLNGPDITVFEGDLLLNTSANIHIKIIEIQYDTTIKWKFIDFVDKSIHISQPGHRWIKDLVFVKNEISN